MSEFENGAVINVEMTPKDNINVVIGEAAKIEAQEAITYIKSGKKEIEKAVDDGINTFDANATQKTNDFNDNASDKTNDFNDNATNKTNDFNDNYTTKLGDFNTNATNKTNDFNTNATNKTNAFNGNAAIKQAAVDASAAEAKQWAIGDPTEPTGNSAKYWANQASSTVANCVTLNTAQTITGYKTVQNDILFTNDTERTIKLKNYAPPGAQAGAVRRQGCIYLISRILKKLPVKRSTSLAGITIPP